MANLLSNTTVGGNAVITTSNIGTYALTSIPATISPTNIYVGNAIYFNAGNNYLNWSGSRINSNVGIQSAVDMVAPIFYDSNDTSYYADFASTSDSAVRVRGGALFGPNPTWGAYLQIGGNGNNSGSYASVVTTNGNLHLDATNGYSTYINHYYGSKINFGSGGAAGGTYIHSNFSAAGYLNLGGGSGDASYRLDITGTGRATGDFRAPIFYDSADNGYYVDPNGLSVLSHIRLNNNWANAGINQGAINIRGQYPSMQFRNTVSDSMWLRHMDGSGTIQHYYASDGVDSSNWSIKHSMFGNGNFSSVGTHTASQFNGSGAGLTGTASSLSVNYATGAGALGGYSLDTMKKYIWSRGENLLTNGTGLMGNNTNFTSFTFDGSQAYFSSGSFRYTGRFNAPNTDELMPVNPEKRYRLDFWAKTANGQGAYYAFLNFFDVDGLTITAVTHMYYANTLTTLAQTLNPGDTVVYLTSAANWENGGTAGVSTHIRSFIFWNYSNSFGYLYPPETYSQNWYGGKWNPGAVNYSNNTITLISPWNGPSIASGTKLSNGSAGGTFKYIALGYTIVPTTWTNYVGIMDGVDYSGTNAGGKFPPGTASARLGFLTDYNASDDTIYLANLFVGVDNDYPIYDRWTGSTRIEKSGAFYGTIFYDSNDSNFYLNPNATSRLSVLNTTGTITTDAYLYTNYNIRIGEIWGYGGVYRSSGEMLFGTEGYAWRWHSGNVQKALLSSDGFFTTAGGMRVGSGDLYLDQNYGRSVVGLYASDRYQGVFAMGDSYKLSADGTSSGSLYGIAWTHTNVGGQSKSGLGHQALFMANGSTQTAIGYGIWTNGLITTTSYGTSSNWNTAYGWGNHASAGYITSSGSISGTAGSISGFNNPTTASTANTIAYRDASGDIAAREFVLTAATVHTVTPSSIVGIFPTTNQVVKFSASAIQTFLGLGSLAYSSATIPTNNNQLTNGAGYITGYTETDTLASVTGRGATTASQISFTKTDDHAISVGTIRGRAVGVQGGEFIQLYERVNIGGPSGWGASNTSAPSYGLSVYGGATIGYGNSAGLTVTGTTNATRYTLSGTGAFMEGYGSYSSKLGRVAIISLDWNANYDEPFNHGITSTDSAGNFADSLSINSFNDITLRLDSNNNNAESYVRIMNNTSGTNTIAHIGYNGANGTASFSRDLFVNGGTGGNFGNRIVVGSDSTPYTLQDGNIRPTVYLTGAYPVMTLNHTVTGNTSHGPTIQFTFNGSSQRQWVIGCGGAGDFMDFGFSSNAYGNSDYNPHNGIAGYVGNTIMRIIDNAVGIGGDWGAHGSGAGNPAYTLDVRGTIYSNTDMRAPIFYDSANTGYYGDFASTSVMNAIRFGTSTNNGTLNGAGDWGMRLTTDAGYIQFGPANSSYAHIYTDRGTFYFNRDLLVNGNTVITAATIGSQTVANASNATTAGSLTSMNISQFTNNSGYLTSLPSHNHDDRYLVKGGSWYGVGLPGSRWGGFTVNGGEIVFGDGLPNAGQMGMLIDGAYLAGENNGFWSLPSDNSWSGRRGMYWNGTYLDFTANSPTAQFTTLRLANGFEFQQGGSDYGRFSSWVHLNGYYGLYSGLNGAHIYPNNGSYGSWQMLGSRGGWQGIEFGSGSNGAVTLMINADSNTSGFHNNSYGWQFRWNNGTLYCYKNAYGAGTEATVLDSSNYSSWAQPIASAINTANIGSQSVSYATTSGALTSMNISQFTNNSGYITGSYVVANGTSAGDIDADWGQSFKTFDPVPSGTPPLASPNIRTINVGENYARRTQLAFNYSSDQAWFRRRQDSTWGSWREFIHSGNISTQTVATAGALSSMNISQFTNNSGYITGYTETNTFLGDGGAADTHPGTSRLIFTGQVSSGAEVLGMPANDNSNAFLNINRHPGEYNSQLGFSSNGSMYYRSFSAAAINNSQAWRQVWDSGNLTNLNQLSNGPGYITGLSFDGLSSKASGTGTYQTSGDFRAPIFYDSADTSYYIDPNDVSQLNITKTALRAHKNMTGYGVGNWISDFSNTPVSSMTFGQDKYDGGPSGTWWFQVNMRHNNGSNLWGTQLAYGWEDNSNEIYQRNVTGGSWSGWVRYINSSNYASILDARYYTESEVNSLLSAKQDSSTAITTSNIGSQSVSYATTAGTANAVAWGNVSSKPSLIMYYQGFTLDANTMDGNSTGFTYSVNAPFTGPIARFSETGYSLQLNAAYGGGGTGIAFRTRNGDTGSFNTWRVLLNDSNYTSYSPSLTGSGASGTWGINISGNAATATTATNFNNGTVYSSAGVIYVDTLESVNTNDWLELTYYGGLGVRIGTGVNGSKALYAGSLYDAGNRVYSAGNPQVNISGNAATVGGYAVSGSVGANTVVIRDANNYIYAYYINSSVSETENPTINSFYTSNGDGWLRKSSVAHVKSQLGLGSMAYESSGTYQTVSGAINTGNIGSQSVSYATVSQQLTKFGDIYGQDWNSYFITGKLIVSNALGHSGSNRPINSYDYGTALSYGETGGPLMQIYLPEDAGNTGGSYRALAFRSGYNGTWSSWKTVVDQVGNTCTIAGSNGTGVQIHSNVGYGQNPLTYFLLRGQADGSNWNRFKILLTGDAAGQDIEFRRINNNDTTDARMFYVPRGLNQVIFDYTVVQPSDSRLKDNLTPITTPVEKIKSLRGVEFDWNSGEHVGTHDVGLIAQDVEAVLPEAVTTQEDGYKNLAYTKVIPLLVEAMKEQQTMIEALRAEIELLKNK